MIETWIVEQVERRPYARPEELAREAGVAWGEIIGAAGAAGYLWVYPPGGIKSDYGGCWMPRADCTKSLGRWWHGGSLCATAGDRPTCGAKTPDGPCENIPVDGRARCRLHGGATPRGADSPHYRHGRWAKAAAERPCDEGQE